MNNYKLYMNSLHGTYIVVNQNNEYILHKGHLSLSLDNLLSIREGEFKWDTNRFMDGLIESGMYIFINAFEKFDYFANLRQYHPELFI